MENIIFNNSPYNGRWAKLHEISQLKQKPFWYDITWLSWLRLFLKCPEGISVNGRLHLPSQRNVNENTVLIGKSGLGKSSAIFVPTILRNTQNSMVITDPGELFEICSGTLAKRDIDVHKLDVAGMISATFNYMDYVHTRSQARLLLTLLFMASGHNANGKDNFWIDNAIAFGVVLTMALIKQPEKKYRTIAQLRMLVLEFGNDGRNLDNFIDKYVDEEMWKEYEAFVKSEEKVRLNTLATLRSALMPFTDEKIQKLTSSTSIDLSQLRKKKTVIFFKIPEGEIQNYKFIITLFYQAVFTELMKEPEKGDLQVSLILDEMANSGLTQMDSFAQVCNQLRKKGASILGGLQDMGQLEELGRGKLSSIMEGAISNKIYLSGMSLSTAEYISRLLGTTVRTYVDHEGVRRETVVPLYTADQLKIFPKNVCIIETPHTRPILLVLHPYYYNPWLKRLIKRYQAVEIKNPLYDQPIEFLQFENITTMKS